MTTHRQWDNTSESSIELSFMLGLRKRRPKDVRILKPLGDLLTRVGKLEEGLQVDLELAMLCSEEPEVWYNLGCSYALNDRVDDALDSLERAINLGYSDLDWMRADEDLMCLHDHPRFRRFCTWLTMRASTHTPDA